MMNPAQPFAASDGLRSPDEVMTLARLGASFPTRLSFMRSLIRQLHNEHVRVERPVWKMDRAGHGHAVYSLKLGGRRYSLVAFSRPLDDDQRSDRVIAEAWDTAYVLFDGFPKADDIARLSEAVPRQEAGRYRASELILSRANKSMRLFSHVVDCLAQGKQPDPDEIAKVGYLLRTTAVYGNGKFGISDRSRIQHRPELAFPFRAEMLTVWLIRGFSIDLAEHVARAQNPVAAQLSPKLRRFLGVGNATGLGMAPFLVNHPLLLSKWFEARETALARVRAIGLADEETRRAFRHVLDRAIQHTHEWNVADAPQMERIKVLRRELAEISALATLDWLAEPSAWDHLIETSHAMSLDTQEALVALILEPHGALIDDLAAEMAGPSAPRLVPGMRCLELSQLVARHYRWVQDIDFESPEARARFWYVSADKQEPRLGERATEPGSEKETRLDIAWQVRSLATALDQTAGEATVAELVLHRPHLRSIAARVQAVPSRPYAEIHGNLVGSECLPIDLLRAKLAFFGASKFDPKSDRWTRITLCQGAPGFDEIGAPDADDWAFPVLGTAS